MAVCSRRSLLSDSDLPCGSFWGQTGLEDEQAAASAAAGEEIPDSQANMPP